MEPRIRASDRLLLVGKTRSGKSTLASYFFSLFRVQRVLIDPKGEWNVRGALIVRSPEQLAVALEKSTVVRYVPSSSERDEWERVYQTLFERRRVFLWTDEAYSVSTKSWQPSGLRLIQTQGAGLGIGHMSCTQRPVNIAPELISETDHIFVFPPPFARRADLTDVAEQMGLTRDELRAQLLELEQHGFLWFDRRLDELTAFGPLPAELRRQANATARTL